MTHAGLKVTRAPHWLARTVNLGQLALTLAPLTESHLALLRELESPMLTAAAMALDPHRARPLRFEEVKAALQHAGEVELDFAMRMNTGCIETIFVLSQPMENSRLLLSQGRAILTDAAMELVADNLPYQLLTPLFKVLGDHVASNCAAMKKAASQRSFPA